MVLDTLTEGLHMEERKISVLKLFFILATASTCQFSGLHALCIKPLLVWYLTLRLCQGRPQRWHSLQILSSSPYPEFNNLIVSCPCLVSFLWHKTCSRRENFLFVHWDEDWALCPLSKWWFSSLCLSWHYSGHRSLSTTFLMSSLFLLGI